MLGPLTFSRNVEAVNGAGVCHLTNPCPGEPHASYVWLWSLADDQPGSLLGFSYIAPKQGAAGRLPVSPYDEQADALPHYYL